MELRNWELRNWELGNWGLGTEEPMGWGMEAAEQQEKVSSLRCRSFLNIGFPSYRFAYFKK